MYNKEEEIIHFVFKAFYGMDRVKEKIPLSFHSILVGNMLKNENLPEDIVYIGYLHDIIEDTSYTYEDLLNKFGKNIADGVLSVSENKEIKKYRERKENFINNLKNCNNNILYIELADKLHNLLSDYSLFEKYGKEELYSEADKYEDTKWYYLEFKKLFNERINNNSDMLKRFNEIVDIYFK